MENIQVKDLAHLNPSTKKAIIKAIMADIKLYDDRYNEVEVEQYSIASTTVDILVSSLESEVGFTDLLTNLME